MGVRNILYLYSLNDFKCLFPDGKQPLNHYNGAFTYETKKIIKILI